MSETTLVNHSDIRKESDGIGRVVCTSTTSENVRCTAWSLHGSNRCRHHSPPRPKVEVFKDAKKEVLDLSLLIEEATQRVLNSGDKDRTRNTSDLCKLVTAHTNALAKSTELKDAKKLIESFRSAIIIAVKSEIKDKDILERIGRRILSIGKQEIGKGGDGFEKEVDIPPPTNFVLTPPPSLKTAPPPENNIDNSTEPKLEDTKNS